MLALTDWLSINLHRARNLNFGPIVTSDWCTSRESVFLFESMFLTDEMWRKMQTIGMWNEALNTIATTRTATA